MLIDLAGQGLGAAVRRACRDDVGGDLTLRPGLDRDVEEARPGDLDLGDAVGGAEPLGDEVGEGARVGPGLLGQLEGHVGGVVAVTLLPGSLHRDLGRHAVGQRDRAVGHEGLQHVDDGLGELIGIHRASLSAGPGAGRTGFTPWPAEAPRVLP